MPKASPLSTSSPTLVISCLFDDGQSDSCEVISHRGFCLRFPGDEWQRASFHGASCHLETLALNEDYEEQGCPSPKTLFHLHLPPSPFVLATDTNLFFHFACPSIKIARSWTAWAMWPRVEVILEQWEHLFKIVFKVLCSFWKGFIVQCFKCFLKAWSNLMNTRKYCWNYHTSNI